MTDWTQAPKGVHFFWFPIPAYSSLTVLLWIMHARLWTLFVALAVCGFLAYLHVRGRSLPWLLRRMKSKLRGGIVYARPVWVRRRTQHLQSFDLINLKD